MASLIEELKYQVEQIKQSMQEGKSMLSDEIMKRTQLEQRVRFVNGTPVVELTGRRVGGMKSVRTHHLSIKQKKRRIAEIERVIRQLELEKARKNENA